MKYHIAAGNHYTTRLQWPFTFKRSITKTIRFSESSVTKVDDDISKLFGLSDNWSHQTDSIRIGWRGEGSYISLHAYIYRNGERTIKWLCNVWPGEAFKATVSITQDEYLIHITRKGDHLSEPFDRHSRWSGLRYFLRPYFGGNLPAPVDIEIDLV
jgi:hypothetical protein